MKKIKSESIILIALAILLIIIVAIITYLNYLTQRANRKALLDHARNTQQSGITPTSFIFPTNQLSTQAPLLSKPLIEWDEQASRLLFKKVLGRKPLTESDEKTKIKTLSLLPKGERSGTLNSTPNININYTYGKTDVWEVEILSTNINLAKEEAVKWFFDQGFSQDFICNYPVEFYLNGETAQRLSNTNIIFNPLAPNCL